MPNCPNCNTAVPTEAQYCPECGESIGTSCPECGTRVDRQANFCPDCGSDLGASERGMSQDAGRSSSHDWRLAADEFAKRLGPNARGADSKLEWLKGHENVRIETGNRALLLVDGAIEATLEPGKHTLDTFVERVKRLGDSRQHEVVVVEDTGTSVSVHLENVRTSDESLVDVDLELSVAVDDHERFYESMMGSKEVVTGRTFQDAFAGRIREVVEQLLSGYDREELYGNPEVAAELEAGIEEELAGVLSAKGMALSGLRTFDYRDHREEVREQREAVDIEREKEAVREEKQDVEHRARERQVEDHVHEARQEARAEAGEEIAEATADHEVRTTEEDLEHDAEMQTKENVHEEIQKDHEIEDTRREHEHEAERETVEHEEDLETTRTESEVQRRDLEHEQDVKEMQDLMEVKKEKDFHDIDVAQAESEIDMREEEHALEMELEMLEARDDVDATTLASLAETDEGMADIAKMVQAGELDLSPEQLDSLGARENDELAKARQEAEKAAHERQRVEDHEEFREEVREMAEESLDRMQETTDKAMDSMEGAAEAAAEDTSDNVIVPGSGDGSGSSGDTTIVQGGGGTQASGGTPGDDGQGGTDQGGREGGDGGTVPCPDCESPVDADAAFCTNCGSELE